MSFKVGDTVGNYTLLAECGTGAYGAVFLAENAATKRLFALKIVYRHGNNSSRELRGLIRYQQVCSHTNLLQIYHVEESDDFFFYTMDPADNSNEGGHYVPDTLGNRLKKQGRLQPDTVKKMVRDLMEDLETLHRKGLLHRDIKPDNIFWIHGKATLGDIGLVTDGTHTTLAGTPGFLAPELLAGLREYRKEDDYYALGKVIYCAVTGLPVSHYPEFPDSGTLTGTGDLITLYNRLCSGEYQGTEKIVPTPRRRKGYKKVLLPACLLLVFVSVSGILYTLLMEKHAAPEQKLPEAQIPAEENIPTISVPESITEAAGAGENTDPAGGVPAVQADSVPKIQMPPKNAIRLAAETERAARERKTADDRKALQRLMEKYAGNDDFAKLLPRLEKAYREMEKECYGREMAAYNRAVSPENLTDARKSGDVQLALADSRALQAQIRIKRRNAARESFEKQLQTDPVWEYFSNRQKLAVLLKQLEIAADSGDPAFTTKLQMTEQIFSRQKELEDFLLKKYEK